ncbi:MAG: hypothetical protein AAF950_04860 [Pseudomonadota bacterium]
MSADGILALLGDDLPLILSGAAVFLAFLAFITAWRALVRGGRARKELAELANTVRELEAAERKMALAIEAGRAAPKAVPPASQPRAPSPKSSSPPMPNVPRVDTAQTGDGPPNMFSTQQGISDLTRYRKKN